VRILFQDESRFGRINEERRSWSPANIRAEVATQVVREFIYAVAAVSPLDGLISSLVLPWVNTTTMSIFLNHTAMQFSDDFNIMFLDGAGWHKSNDLRVPENIRLVFLPPYSPELNPAESVWEHLRENSFGNRSFETLDEVEEVLCAGLKKLHDNPLIVKSLTCYKWINTISLTSN